jgi:hypothetical protein
MWPVAKASGVEGPGDLVLGPGGWQQRQHPLGDPDPGVDLTRLTAPELVAIWRTATVGDLKARAADELAARIAQATEGD